MIASVSGSAVLVGSSSVLIVIITASAMRVCGSNSVSSFSSGSNSFSYSCSDKDSTTGVAAAGALLAPPIATVPAAPAPACVAYYHQPISFSGNKSAVCVFRNSSIFRPSKWQHQLQLSTSGSDDSNDYGVA
jgi:hypothetical protein